MPEPISRRQFLRDSAVASGAVLVIQPSLLRPAPGRDGPARGRGRTPMSGGVFAQVTRGGAEDSFVKRWTRLGGDYALDLLPMGLVVHVPTQPAVTVEQLTLDEFERGLGHHEIARDFGTPALAELRTEVANLRMFGAQQAA